MTFIDANIFMYAAGAQSPQRAACQAFVRSLASREPPEVFTNAEVLQEILHRYRAIGRAAVAFEVLESVLGLGLPIFPITESDVRTAAALLRDHDGLSTRDAVHLGVVHNAGFSAVLSYDRGFDAVPWVRRSEPTG